MKITTQQIADLCNVSRGTVDRVLHNRPNVHPQIRQNVLRMIERTGYRPPKARQDIRRQFEVGMILPKFHDRYFLSHSKHGVKSAMERIDNEHFHLSIEQLGGRSPEEHIATLERMLQHDLDGLLINAPYTPEITHLLNRFHDRGVRVMCYYDEQPDCPHSFFVGQDCVRSGRIAAGLISKYMNPGDHILVVSGDPIFHSHQTRVNSFVQHLHEQTGNTNCIDVVWCHEFFDITAQTIHEKLMQDERIRYIYMATQSDSGCIEGIRRAGRSEPVMVICNDTTATARNLLQKGQIDFVIGQSVTKTISQAIELLYQILCLGMEPRYNNHYSDLTIYTRQMLQALEGDL